jgi:hypothetical protein
VNRVVRGVAATVLVAFVLAVALLLLGCDKVVLPQPAPCATWQAPDGTWMEEDNEPVDDDPCDRLPDVKVSTVKPPVKPSPAKPIGGQKKRF